jgi:hypothetical protein
LFRGTLSLKRIRKRKSWAYPWAAWAVFGQQKTRPTRIYFCKEKLYLYKFRGIIFLDVELQQALENPS